ncbi:MAG: hypothetical protein IKK45_04315 [Akkermansia sp.]|nr:hypothetical protein [Akkermansia sp.]
MKKMKVSKKEAAALEQQERTVSFERAVEEALEARKDRRARTLSVCAGG